MPRMDATAWATWIGVIIMVIGGAISVGVLYEGQKDTASALTTFIARFDKYTESQDAKYNRLDDRVRNVEIAEGHR